MSGYLAVFLGALLGGGLRGALGEFVVVWLPTLSAIWAMGVINALGCAGFGVSQVLASTEFGKHFWLTGCWGSFTSFSAITWLLMMAQLTSLGLGFIILAAVVSVCSWVAFYRGGYWMATLWRSRYE